MASKRSLVLVGGLAVLAVGVLFALNYPGQADVGEPIVLRRPPAPEPEKEREADREAIKQSARAFAQAFAKGDAKAVAALWADKGECHEASGELIRGRDAIEKAFAQFFQDNPGVKIEVLIESIRFPSADVAVEEGLLRQSRGGRTLPSTTLYSTTHVREGGQWKMAVSQEWAAGQDRLEDLEWLVGTWKATLPDQEVTLTFARDEKKPFLVGQFTRTAGAKVVSSGSMRVGFDADSGQLRSWHFDGDGGHGQALWVRDGNRWVLDAVGVLGDGTPTEAVNVLGRVSPDALTWRSIDRLLGGQPLPDTVPLRLSRVAAGK